MNKEDRPIIIMSDTDYAKLSDMLINTPASEGLGVLLDCIKVVADAKTEKRTEKRLWKARSFCVYKLPIQGQTEYSDMMELTVDEAISWYKKWAEHLNEYKCDSFTVYSDGLFYKKDGEWIRYLIEE